MFEVLVILLVIIVVVVAAYLVRFFAEITREQGELAMKQAQAEEQRRAHILPCPASPGEVLIDYTNHRGVRRMRRIIPQALLWSPHGTDWHKEPQWILWAADLENGRKPIKGFAMSGIHSWKPANA